MGQVISMKDFRAARQTVANECEIAGVTVGKPFPLLAPDDGVRMDIFDGVPSIILSVPDIRPDEIDAFRDGVISFQLLVSETTAPVIIWSFKFTSPINLLEVNFNHLVANPAELKKLATRTNHDFFFILISGGVCVGICRLNVSNECWDSWLVALKKQKDAQYSDDEYSDALKSLYDFSPEELLGEGTPFNGIWKP